MKVELLAGIALLVTSGVFSPIDRLADIIITCVFSFFIIVVFQFFGYKAV
jgi:hypothetical protein